MNKSYICYLAVLLPLSLAHLKPIPVETKPITVPQITIAPQVKFEPSTGIIADVSADADALFMEYGYRPSYHGPQFAAGQDLTSKQAQSIAPYILTCESGNKDGLSCGIDSNGKPSCGRAQFQDWSTFWEPASGITGDPLNGNDAITMMLWALEHGYIGRWSCARIEKITK